MPQPATLDQVLKKAAECQRGQDQIDELDKAIAKLQQEIDVATNKRGIAAAKLAKDVADLKALVASMA